MAKKKPEPQFFRTVTDMLTVPTEKLDHFIEDLRLWLHMQKKIAEIQREVGNIVELKQTTPIDAFGWVDDGKHDARIKIDLTGLGILQDVGETRK